MAFGLLLAISTLKDTFYYYLYDKLYYTPNMCVYYWQVIMKGLAFWVFVFAFGRCVSMISRKVTKKYLLRVGTHGSLGVGVRLHAMSPYFYVK